MSISTRMKLQAMITTILFVAMAAVSLLQVNRLINSASYVTDNVVPSMELVNNAYSEFLGQRTSTLMYIVNTTPNNAANIKASYEQAKAATNKALADYQPYISDDKDKALLDAVQQGMNKVSAIYASAISASDANNKQEAERIMTNSRPDFMAVQAAAKAHIDYNKMLELERKQDLHDTAQTTSLSLLLLSVVGMLVIAATTFRTYRQVVGSIQQASNDFSKLTQSMDLSIRCSIRHQDEIGSMLGNFNAFAQKLQSSIINIRHSSSSLISASETLRQSASHVSQSSITQSESASAMAAALEQITVSINHVANRTADADKLAKETENKANSGEQVIGKATDTITEISGSVSNVSTHMDALSSQASSISTVVNVIKDVADQTNLLALNAAIEAARAGEQGRGFAVVADEVRKLAERTAQSTSEINTMVSAIQHSSSRANDGVNLAVDNVKSGVSAAESALLTIRTIAGAATQNQELVEEIAEAIREQSHAANNISQQVEAVAQMSEQNVAAANNVSTLARDLFGIAQQMQSELQVYKT